MKTNLLSKGMSVRAVDFFQQSGLGRLSRDLEAVVQSRRLGHPGREEEP